MKSLFLIFLCFSIVGCCNEPKIIDHKIMVQVPCRVTMPEKPIMPLTETGKIEEDIFLKTKKALAELDIRKGYAAQLEAVARSCE